MFWRVGPPSPSTQPMSRAIACGVARSTPSSATAASNCVWSSADHVNRGARGPSVWGGSAIAATMAPLGGGFTPHARRRAAVEVVSRGSRSAIARRSSSPRWAGSAIVAAARCAKCSCAARSASKVGGGAGSICTGAGSAAGVGFATAVFVGTRVPRPRRRWTKPSTTNSAVAHGAHATECGGSASKTTSRGPLHRCVWFTSRYRWSTWSCVRIVVHSPAPRALANSPCIDSVIARTRRASTKIPCCTQSGQNLFLRWPFPGMKPRVHPSAVEMSAAPQHPVSALIWPSRGYGPCSYCSSAYCSSIMAASQGGQRAVLLQL